MPDSTTPNFGWTLPTVGAASATWGVSNNNNWASLDNTLHTGLLAVASMSTVITGPNNVVLNSGAPPAQNAIVGRRNNLNRWAIIMPDAETGTGPNPGDNFLIQSYDDTGSALAQPLEVVRSSGQVVINNGLSVAAGSLLSSAPVTFSATFGVSGLASFGGGITFPNFNGGHTIQFGWDGTSLRAKVDAIDLGAVTTSTTPGAYLPLTGGTISGNLAVAGTTSLGALTSGATTNSSLTVTGAATFASLSATGTATFGAAATFSAAATFNSTLTATGLVTLNGGLNVAAGNITNPGTITGGTLSTTSGSVLFPSSWKIYYNPSSSGVGTSSLRFNAAGLDAFEFDTSGDLGINGQAYKPGGGSWANSSDARIKTIEARYELGLDEILKLDPVVYRFMGNDAAAGGVSRHAAIKNQSFVGLVAQEVEAIFPGMVSKTKGWIDGQEVDDFRRIDASELVYALINAVKTLAARVEALEAK
jgi:hypothetical protein